MRIVIDLQGAQTKRPIDNTGRYSLSIAQAIARCRGDREVIIALNGLFPESVISIRHTFEGLLPQENIKVWFTPRSIDQDQTENFWRREAAKRIREHFLIRLNPDVLLISSLFEGFNDDAVTSIGIFLSSFPIVVALCDHLPKANSANKSWLVEKMNYLEQAQSTFVFSRYLDTDELDSLKLPRQKIIHIPLDKNVSSLPAPSLQLDKIYTKKILKALDHAASCSILSIKKSLGFLGINQKQYQPVRKLRLAYVSPLPLEKTGIADYSAELLPALAKYYDITAITEQDKVTAPWIQSHCAIHNAEWLRKNYRSVDRVLYHIGNSHFHCYMFDLLQQVPGTVVMHDFFLGDAWACKEFNDGTRNAWQKELYYSHGYIALLERNKNSEIKEVIKKYPTNLSIRKNARGIIVHSSYAKSLFSRWYENESDVKIIPLLRTPANLSDKNSTKSSTAFRVCSFGLLGPTKLNHRLLKAWQMSRLSKDKDCKLIFVGENHNDDYGNTLLSEIKNNQLQSNVTITGWSTLEDFKRYLSSADLAVQLRTTSRGETSASVLDCMNNGIPTIVNANGSMAELPQDAVWMLPDEFTDEELVDALETLWKDKQKRQALTEKAKREIELNHSPEACARQYYEAIEAFYAESDHGLPAQIQALADISAVPTQKDLMSAAQALSLNFPSPLHSKQLLIDISATCRTDLKTGIERVARAITMELLKSPPTGYRVEPVYLDQVDGQWRYRYARKFTLKALDCPQDILEDQIIEAQSGDILLCVDLSGQRFTESHKAGLFHELKALGVKCSAIVYDLLPLTAPECFPPQSEKPHSDWLKAVSDFDGCSCISQAVAEEMRNWLTQVYGKSKNKFKVNFFHMGADLENSIPTRGLPKDADYVLGCIKEKITFLMVGTIEPRKNYLQVLDAFDRLWKDNLDCNLVIVGREGWRDLPQEARRNIPETVDRLSRNPQLGKHLFWLQGISDEYLEKVYERSACLIFASLGEGFGLPLIEAAKHKLPIIARDLPVFREVAGQHAFYFTGTETEDLSGAIKEWLELYKNKKHPTSDDMPWQTWRDSVQQILAILCISQ